MSKTSIVPASLLVEEARKYVGIKEVGRNEGWNDAAFKIMMKKAGWVSSHAWCMYFAKAVWMTIYQDSKHYDHIVKTLNGSTIMSYRKAKMSDLIVVRDMPTLGGIVIWETSPGRGHAGVVSKVRDELDINTVEGNTSPQGSREGDTILERRRHLNAHAQNWRYLGCLYPPEMEIEDGEDTQEDIEPGAGGSGGYGFRPDSAGRIP